MGKICVRDAGARGRGVFATRPIAAGETIEVCPVIELPEAQLPAIDRTILGEYYFGWGRDGALPLGYGLLYNHAEAPNAICRREIAERVAVMVAVRQIDADEEITVRYSTGGPDMPLWFKPV